MTVKVTPAKLFHSNGVVFRTFLLKPFINQHSHRHNLIYKDDQEVETAIQQG